MRLIQIATLAAGVLATGAVFAQSGADVAKAKGCLNCHAVDTKKMGPSFKDIAAKYKSDPGAATKLAGELKAGKGHPVKVTATDDELKAVLGYVLSTK